MNLKHFRNLKRMTQEEVAAYLGIPTKTYQNYEREVREADSVTLCALADLYDVTLDALIGRATLDESYESVLLGLFRALNATGQAHLVEIADDMVQSRKYEWVQTRRSCRPRVPVYRMPAAWSGPGGNPLPDISVFQALLKVLAEEGEVEPYDSSRASSDDAGVDEPPAILGHL